MPLIGDTIRLKGEFRDYDKNLVDIDNPKVIIYGAAGQKIHEVTPVKQGTGIYYYDYTVPGPDEVPWRGNVGGPDEIDYEFSGELAGKPILSRASFVRIRWNEEEIKAAYLGWIEDYCNNRFDKNSPPWGVQLALEKLMEIHRQSPNIASESVGDLSRSFFSGDIPANIKKLLQPYRRLTFK